MSDKTALLIENEQLRARVAEQASLLADYSRMNREAEDRLIAANLDRGELKERIAELEQQRRDAAVCLLGIRGSMYDPPNTYRAYTYKEQPNNVGASRLGQALMNAAVANAGDSIDRGLSLLKELSAAGFGVFDLAAIAASAAEGDGDA